MNPKGVGGSDGYFVPDEVAQKVKAGAGSPVTSGSSTPGEEDSEGAVMFKGWLLADAAPGRIRFFTDPGFREWLEIPSSAILHQMPGAADPNAEKRSIIWVKREARITLCRSGCAYLFQEQEAFLDRDPTARQPR